MQRIVFTLLLIFISIPLLIGQDWKGREDWPTDFPRPEQTDRSLFFIQRNLNKHTIMYDLNFNPDGTLNFDQPIDNYWRQYESTGHRRELSWLESWLAYGYKAKKKKDNTFRIKLRAHNERHLMLKQDAGKWRVIIPINGEESYLTNIYAYADESGIIPDVIHVDIYGINIKTGIEVKERIYD